VGKCGRGLGMRLGRPGKGWSYRRGAEWEAVLGGGKEWCDQMRLDGRWARTGKLEGDGSEGGGYYVFFVWIEKCQFLA